MVVWHFIFRSRQNWDEHIFAKIKKKEKKNNFSVDLVNIKEMFRYKALQVVCSFIICQSLKRKHPRFPCLVLRDAVYEKSYPYRMGSMHSGIS